MEFGGVLTVFLLAVLILLELHAASGQQHGPLWYSRDQLLALRPAGGADVASIHNIPDMIRKTYRGRRGKGRRTKRRRNEARKERRRYKPYLPSLIMGNVRSLANKMDELSGLVGSQREYQECSLMCFSETWLHSDIPDNNVTTEGFQTVRADRDCTETGKRKGGGVAVLVNNKWCNPGHITTKEKICRPDIELLAVGLRPYYLPREISHVIVVVVYIPPSANATTACDVMHSTIAGLQTKHPSALILISGDFNHVTMKKTLPEFKQYVNCPTRGDRTLDLLYANVKEAYSSSPLPPLGRSDHNLVYLDPCYVPLVKQQPAITKTVRRWSDEALETLRVCFEVTDWQALCDPHGEDIDSIVECITAYINFCVDCIIPTRTVHCYANNKPWVTKDIKAILNAKKSAFRAGNREEVRAIQVDLRIKIRQAKEKYRKKLEFSLQNNDMRKVWSGMKTITGFRPSGGGGAEGGVDRANELNLFFNRFDTVSSPASQHLVLPPTARPHSTPNPPLPHSPSHPTVAPHPSPSVSQSPSPPPTHPTVTPHPPPPSGSQTERPFLNGPPPLQVTTAMYFTAGQVRRGLEKLHPGKAAGPDGVSPKVLKACAPQLCGVLQRVFNMSLRLQRVPVLWKTSCIVPVPKTPRPSGAKDYRPVALTSHIMKVLERLVLEQLRPVVKPRLDPLQFAYQPRLGVEDAIIYLLNRAYAHLDKPASTVRVMFFDFSSAFNTIRPALLGEKLTAMQVEAPVVSWIVDYLSGRPQYVRLQHCVSDRVVSNTGAPQGTVLSPFLFTIYTSDFSYMTESCHLQKFSDDSAIVGCISKGEEEEYRAVVDNFVTWCELNHLQLNVTKTKELVVDLRRSKAPLTPLSIQGVSVDRVEDYKYLGVYLDDKLNWARNTEALYKKGQSRLYFLRRLRSFNICRTMLQMFYESVVAGAFLYAAACWGSGLRASDANRLNKLIRKASSIVGVELSSLEAVTGRRMLSRLRAIQDSVSHPLHNVLANQQSTFSARLLQLRCTTDRHRKSFLPAAIKLHNSSLRGSDTIDSGHSQAL